MRGVVELFSTNEVMTMSRKLVLIGAGSAIFTQGLVADLILNPDLGPWELGLVDIDEKALRTAQGLADQMVAMKNADITVQASLDRTELLPEADYVVCTVGVGGRRAWEKDVFIPRKYGIYQPTGDSVMPGGVSRALRMIPVMVEIARDIEDLCPEAWFFNYSNPMTAICWAVREASGVPVIGLCHGLPFVIKQLAYYIGAHPEEVTALYAGLNHLTFIFDLRWNGVDGWNLVRERLAKEQRIPLPHEDRWQKFLELGDELESFEAADNPLSWSLFDMYGAYPSCNDRHVTEFFPERFPNGEYYGKTLGVDAFTFEGTVAQGDKIYADMQAQALGEQPINDRIFEPTAGEHEYLLDIIRAIEFDSQTIYAANLPNLGAVPNLPYDAILEIPAVVTASGLRPLQITDFSDPLAELTERKFASARLSAQAALVGERSLFVDALLADGSVVDRKIAEKLANELLEAQREYLPNFFSN